MMDPTLSNFRSKHRAEPVSPKPHRLVADIDAALEQDVVALGSKQSDVVRCPGNGLIRIAPANTSELTVTVLNVRLSSAYHAEYRKNHGY